jgi:hypothetical protein
MSRPPRRRSRAASEWDDIDAFADRHADGDDGLEGERPSALRRIGRLLGMAGGGAAVLGALAIGLFPTQTYLDQRGDTAEAQERLSVLRAQNEAFEERIERLASDEEIERLAREQYNLAYPGEEAYAVLPAPLPELDLPSVWPFGPLLSAPPTTTVTEAPAIP